jgi:hypothetical protein
MLKVMESFSLDVAIQRRRADMYADAMRRIRHHLFCLPRGATRDTIVMIVDASIDTAGDRLDDKEESNDGQ